jgi:Holliday junction resolvase
MRTTTQKKKVNGCAKGKRGERELGKIFSNYFGIPFYRTANSGARPKQVKLSAVSKEVHTGDLETPPDFRFSIECKTTDVEVDLLDQSALLDKYLKQAADDADSIGKVPMLCWKRNRKGWIVAVPSRQAFGRTGEVPQYRSVYRVWIVCRLDALLNVNKGNDVFWFKKEEK